MMEETPIKRRRGRGGLETLEFFKQKGEAERGFTQLELESCRTEIVAM